MTEDQRKWIYYAIPVVVVIAIGAALYYMRTRQAADEQPVAETAAPAPSAEPPVKHPIDDQAAGEQPLPPLAESDQAVHESLLGTFGRSLEELLVPKDIIRNVVVTIDNLPRKKTAVQRWPIKPTAGEFAASGAEELTLNDSNYDRYAAAVKLAQSADAQQLAAWYRRFYPLFQEAYVDLGYPEGYFNDRLVEVIDHLLATPEVQGPIRLTQPGVFYEFADPALEERSAGQKTLIRMGPENAAAIKAKLRELRTAVASQQRQ
jgi:hypothetical protein